MQQIFDHNFYHILNLPPRQDCLLPPGPGLLQFLQLTRILCHWVELIKFLRFLTVSRLLQIPTFLPTDTQSSVISPPLYTCLQCKHPFTWVRWCACGPFARSPQSDNAKCAILPNVATLQVVHEQESFLRVIITSICSYVTNKTMIYIFWAAQYWNDV